MCNFIKGICTVSVMGAIILWHVFVEIPLEDNERYEK
jgi:hypothetical protein